MTFAFLIWIVFGWPFGFSTLPVPEHALYIAVVQVDHKDQGTSADVHIKVFMDDLQSALRNAFPDYRICSEEQCCALNENRIGQYFSGRFQFRIDDEPAPMTLTGCRQENEVYWLSFSMVCPENWKEVAVSADFFMELFPTQSNIINIYHGEEKRFFRTTKNRSSLEVHF